MVNFWRRITDNQWYHLSFSSILRENDTNFQAAIYKYLPVFDHSMGDLVCVFQVKFKQTKKAAEPLLPTQTNSLDTSSKVYDVDFTDFSSPLKII